MIFESIKENRKAPISLLFGTDWGSDCDDVAALDILLKAQKSGLVEIEAIGINSVMRYSAPSLKALCEQYALNIPIGVDYSAMHGGLFCLYQKKLASFCRSRLRNADCPEAFKLYRSTLAAAQGKVLILDVGFPGLMKELLQSPPDEYSALSGTELVKEKVSEMILMGGRWDKPNGKEYNFSAFKANREAAAYICRHCPVPLTFLGYEVGKSVITGGKQVPGLTGTAYAAHWSGKGRPSWDPLAALLAVIGDAEKAGYARIMGKASVHPRSGKNSFEKCENGKHAFLVKQKADSFYQQQIDEILMMHGTAEGKDE